MYKVLIAIFLILIISCKENTATKERTKKVSFTNSGVEGTGKIVDSLEAGTWSYYEDDKLLQEGVFENGLKTGTWKYYLDGREYLVDWDIYTNALRGVKLNYPKNWNLKNTKEQLFLSTIDNDSLDQFLVVIQQDKEKIGLDLKNYVKEVYKVISESEKEVFNKYDLKEITLKDRLAYYAKFTSSNNDTDYITYAVYTEDGNFIYDFTFKTEDTLKNQLNYQIFTDIVYSFFINNKKLFYDNEVVVKAKRLRVEDI